MDILGLISISITHRAGGIYWNLLNSDEMEIKEAKVMLSSLNCHGEILLLPSSPESPGTLV